MLHLEGFDGPMDLLLDLAERQRIDFGRMSVRALAEQFVVAMAQLGDRVAIERRADWLVMATRLVLLRSRLLFPETPPVLTESDGCRADRHRNPKPINSRQLASHICYKCPGIGALADHRAWEVCCLLCEQMRSPAQYPGPGIWKLMVKLLRRSIVRSGSDRFACGLRSNFCSRATFPFASVLGHSTS